MARPAPVTDSSDADLDQSRLDCFLGYRITRAEVRLRKNWMKQIDAKHGLRPVDFSILVLIADNPGVSQRRVGDLLDVSPPNFAVVVDRLEQRGLIRRERSAKDRRVQQLFLTTTAKPKLAAAYADIAKFERDLTDMLSSKEEAVLQRALDRMMIDLGD